MDNWIKYLRQSLFLLLFVFCAESKMLLANAMECHGQGIGWFGISQNNSGKWGIRWIPGLGINLNLFREYQVATETSLNAWYDHRDRNGKIKPYRVWTRLSTSDWEIRLGLQQINFGSASFLRALMWFDRIDPRDPLRMKDGVYGLLTRYYFSNNANLWTWILLGNEEPKGWELFGSEKNRAEWGGRIQWPFSKGEMALSFHQRRARVKEPLSELSLGSHDEFRFGIDGKWDIGPGVWFETCLVHRDLPQGRLKNQHLLTLGTDYTFGLGHGLYVLAEHLVSHATETFFGSGKTTRFSAFMADYPLNLTDRVSGILFWDWENQNAYRFFNWQRTTDRWSVYVMTFWNPKTQFLLYPEASVWTGKGAQCLIVWHF